MQPVGNPEIDRDAYENVELPLTIAKNKDRKIVENLIESVGMSHRKENYPIL